jgi:hypothetical protein
MPRNPEGGPINVFNISIESTITMLPYYRVMNDELSGRSQNGSSDLQMNRREVLRAGAAIPAGGLISNAYPTFDFIEKGTAHFVESALRYDGIPDGASVGYSDDFLRYMTDQEESQLIFTPVAKPEMVSIARGNSVLQQTPSGMAGEDIITRSQNHDGYLPIGFGRELVVTRQVSVEGHFQPPSYTVTASQLSAKINVEGIKEEISAGEEREIPLESRVANIFIPGSEFEDRPDPRRPGQTTRTRVGGSVEQVTVQPTLVVRNHGDVDLIIPDELVWEKLEA